MCEHNDKSDCCNRCTLLFATQNRIIIVIIFTALCIIAYWPSLYINSNKYIQISNLKSAKNYSLSKPNGNVSVLFWTKYYGEDSNVKGHNEGMRWGCPALADRCQVTDNRSLIEESAAVVFHMRDFSVDDLPKFRSPKQRWVFYLIESPPHTHLDEILKNLPPKYQFNWTMTYRRDSDMVQPYGPGTEDMRQSFSKSKSRKEFHREIKNKTKGVAWIVSNCRSSSSREEYVTELKKYISVDVYGKCGNLTCKNYSNCYQVLGRQYKFYLAFENSLCRDYVTEKFYFPLLYSMLPVVYSGADYESIKAPANSFIDVRNFSSAKQLADYLHFLDGNDTAYRHYFDWRFEETGEAPERLNPWCTLCSKLISSPAVPFNHPGKFYQDIHSWWYKEANCQTNISPILASVENT